MWRAVKIPDGPLQKTVEQARVVRARSARRLKDEHQRCQVHQHCIADQAFLTHRIVSMNSTAWTVWGIDKHGASCEAIFASRRKRLLDVSVPFNWNQAPDATGLISLASRACVARVERSRAEQAERRETGRHFRARGHGQSFGVERARYARGHANGGSRIGPLRFDAWNGCRNQIGGQVHGFLTVKASNNRP